MVVMLVRVGSGASVLEGTTRTAARKKKTISLPQDAYRVKQQCRWKQGDGKMNKNRMNIKNLIEPFKSQ